MTEIMLVVAIIGLLLMIAVPSFRRSRRAVRITAFLNDLRIVTDSLELYAMDQGHYPADAEPGRVPAELISYFGRVKWAGGSPAWGQWDWEKDCADIRTGIVFGPTFSRSEYEAIDQRIDDGDLLTGQFRRVRTNCFAYIIE